MDQDDLEALWDVVQGREVLVTFARIGNEVWLPAPDEIQHFKDMDAEIVQWIIEATNDLDEFLSDYYAGFRTIVPS